MEEKQNRMICLTFVRFLNEITATKVIPVGFQLTEKKEKIFHIMLQSLSDFTLPKSKCNLIYKDMNGKTLCKTFKRMKGNNYYINGDVYVNQQGQQINNIFLPFNKKQLQRNMMAMYVPIWLQIQINCYSQKGYVKTLIQLQTQISDQYELNPSFNADLSFYNSSEDMVEPLQNKILHACPIRKSDLILFKQMLINSSNNYIQKSGFHNFTQENTIELYKKRINNLNKNNQQLKKALLQQTLGSMNYKEKYDMLKNSYQQLFQPVNHYYIAGIPVEFPFVCENYQILFMQTILEQLKKGGQIAIQSQTGTGKTLSTLCSLLSSPKVKRLIYCSRTHNQLQHVLEDFKRTSYSKQYQQDGKANPKAKSILTVASSKIFQSENCMCKKSYDQNPLFKTIFDKIKYAALSLTQFKEWLVQEDINVCPYHFTKSAINSVDVLLTPYQYVLSPQICRNIGLDIKGAVVVFDEAHNLEDTAETSCSFTLSLKSLLIAKALKRNDQKLIEFIKILEGFQPNKIYYSHDWVQDIKTYTKRNIKTDKNSFNSDIRDTFQFIANIQEVANGKDFIHYGIYKTKQEIKLNCIESKIAFNFLKLQGFQKLLLMSGTLPNKKDIENLTGLSFQPIRSFKLPNNKKRCFLSCKQKIAGFNLSFTYKNRQFIEKEKILLKFGWELSNIVKNIPKGILVMFPNYPVMEKCYENWVQKDIFNRPLMREFRDKNKAQKTIQEYRDACSKNGALLLFVCRGKYSEGEDFKDDLCRAVIIVGVPNRCLGSPNTQMKYLYFKQKEDITRTSKSLSDVSYSKIPRNILEMFKNISFKKWYEWQTKQAIVQSIGRGIRNCNDFCFIYLCDYRYYNSFVKQFTELPQRQLNLKRLQQFFTNGGFNIPSKKQNILTSPDFRLSIKEKGKYDTVKPISQTILKKRKRKEQHEHFPSEEWCYRCNENYNRRMKRRQGKEFYGICTKYKTHGLLNKYRSCNACRKLVKKKQKYQEDKQKQKEIQDIEKPTIKDNILKDSYSKTIHKMEIQKNLQAQTQTLILDIKEPKSIHQKSTHQSDSIFLTDEEDEENLCFFCHQPHFYDNCPQIQQKKIEIEKEKDQCIPKTDILKQKIQLEEEQMKQKELERKTYKKFMLDANTKHGKKKQKKVYGPYKETKTDGLYAYFKKK